MSDDLLVDVPRERDVVEHRLLHDGRVWDLVSDTVRLDDGDVVREYVDHPGAVAVIALDDDDRVLLLAQYRHPARHVLWEPPAGLLDVENEELVVAAARELAEEADLVAGRWWRLVEFFSSPGGSDERITVFLARDLTPVPEADRYVRGEEEADMVPVWVPLDDAVAGVMAGRLHCPTTVTGVLAAAAARATGWSGLVEVTPS
ncbi:NUDIX domain-containing protein [Cellulomonas xiejunii]|uniref:NUDIX hydrolase n=1 Tax=Cellulomonas xiejunii TaxID=2968083 RepID=A0ABY5KT67_9CELL|nr:NUDIX hydrolase [Cellulomonas xiejunii]MCC2314633.1 NUDIX hydrolase [Cellulomonas xiejunii]MCC2322910.1 NUDIX hydrolase [Cellulomonas xiejunii]UUI73409.1 NUDIX hydrolase [Cellulomonas xiejunii]